jgi:hypothetical protein
MKTPGLLHHGRKRRGFKRLEPPASLRRGFKRLEPTVLSLERRLERRLKRLEAPAALQRRFKRTPEPPASPLQRRIERLEPSLQRGIERLEPAVSRLRRAASARRLRRGGSRGIHIGHGARRVGGGTKGPAGGQR